VEAPLEAVQAALDHSNLATTSVYLRQLEGSDDPWWPKLAAELGLEGGGEVASTLGGSAVSVAGDGRRGLAEQLRRRRSALGWTLEQVAEQAQVSVGMLSLIETGKRGPSLRSWERIRQTLGISEPLPEEAWRQ
jgi:DNA-binding XRE family transcriptional regulator